MEWREPPKMPEHAIQFLRLMFQILDRETGVDPKFLPKVRPVLELRGSGRSLNHPLRDV